MSTLVTRLRASPWMKGSRFHTLVTFATNAFQGVMGLFTGVLAARLLGTTGKGELAAIQAVATIVVTLGTFGLYESVIYYASRQPETAPHESVVTTAGLLLTSLVFIPLAWLLMPLLLPEQRPGVVWGARVYLFIFPAFLLLGAVQSLLRASGQMIRWNVLRVLAQSLWLVVMLLAVWVVERRAELLASGYVALLCVASVTVVVTHRRLWAAGWPPRWPRLRRLLTYGLPLFARTGSRALNVRLDVVVMAALLAAEDVGIYSVAATWSMMLAMIPSAVGAVLFPRLSRERDSNRRRLLEKKALASGTALIVLAAGALAIVAPFALPRLFGDEFAPAIQYAIGLMVSGVVLAISQLLEALVQGRGRTGVLLGAELAGLVVTVVGLIVLLPRLRIWGAVVTSTLAYLTVTALLLVWLWNARRVQEQEETV